MESKGWSNVVSGKQTNAEQMFNYQHSSLGSLEISASKCSYLMRAYTSAVSWSRNTVPTNRSPLLPVDCVSPGLVQFASAGDGATMGLERASRNHMRLSGQEPGHTQGRQRLETSFSFSLHLSPLTAGLYWARQLVEVS